MTAESKPQVQSTVFAPKEQDYLIRIYFEQKVFETIEGKVQFTATFKEKHSILMTAWCY